MTPREGIADIGAELKRIASVPEPDTRAPLLQALAHQDLNYLQAIQFHRVASHAAEAATVRISILSTSTVDHLKPALTVAGYRRGIHFDTHIAPFGQVRQELLNPASSLAQHQPETILFALSSREVLARIATGMSGEDIEEQIADYVDDIASLWTSARAISGATIVQQTLLNTAEPVFGSLDRIIPSAPSNVVMATNDKLVEAAKSSDVRILDLDRATRQKGLGHWYDDAKWLQAKIEIQPAAALDYAELVARLVAAEKGQSKKCLVLDLDNTLWGGVVGDDGIDNLSLGEGSGTGEAFLAIQRYAKSLRERGIILAICSKNEQATAESVFREHPEMVLKLDDIACFVANWDDKARNISHIAEQLNIGLDSLVFVDDNPAERALVREFLPMVAVPELPKDPATYVDCIANAGYFEAVSYTSEDRQRADQYAANARRTSLQSATHSLDDYLASLDMTMSAGPASDIDLPRVSQLINKTNQFNTTTRRRTLEEVRSIADGNASHVFQVRLADRFGDNGLVSALILSPTNNSLANYELDSWVMSCRVFGRQLEHAIMNYLVETLLAMGETTLLASYRPSEKNRIIETLFADFGFYPAEGQQSAADDESRWQLTLSDYTAHATFISTKR